MRTKKLLEDLKQINKDNKDKAFIISVIDGNLALSYFADNDNEIVVKNYTLIEQTNFDREFIVCVSAKMFNEVIKLLGDNYYFKQRITGKYYSLVITSDNSNTELENLLDLKVDQQTSHNLKASKQAGLYMLGLMPETLQILENKQVIEVLPEITETIEPVVEPIVETVIEAETIETIETETIAEIPLKENIREKIIQVSRDLVNLDGIKIELVGQWLWVTGETYKHKETIKKLGFLWSHNKKAWYKAFVKSYSKKRYSLEEIKLRHGSIDLSMVQ